MSLSPSSAVAAAAMMRHKRLMGDLDSPLAYRDENNKQQSAARQRQPMREPLIGRRAVPYGHGTDASRTNYGDHDDDDDDDEAFRWRQAAQMLTEDDRDFYFQRATSKPQQQPQRATRSPHKARNEPQEAAAATAAAVASEEDDDDGRDDNSSISFAQSGCHSILSAWRLKAANRAARAANKRPTSVLSNASSAGKKSAASSALTGRSGLKSPAAQTRIQIGPRSAQHFVTNSRRRRRANELILSTLEARRRAIALNRAGLTGGASPLGSGSYLADRFDLDSSASALLLGPRPGSGGPAAHSLSPSPQPTTTLNRQQQQQQQLQLRRQAASPVGASSRPAPRAALSDLGSRVSPAAQAQRQRALLAAASQRGRRAPPLARLDQNSSDLCSSNCSSSSSGGGGGSGDSIDASSGESQFTQLVTSELAPHCVLLESPAPMSRARRAKSPSAANDELEHGGESKLRRGALKRDSIRRLRLSARQATTPAASQQSSSSDQPPSDGSSSLAANARSMDAATRRRRSTTPTPARPSSGERPREAAAAAASSSSPPAPAGVASRRTEIESNPFLNRHHFRSVSARQPNSRSSLDDARAQSQQRADTKHQRNSWLFNSHRPSHAAAAEQQQQQRRRRPTMMVSDSNSGSNHSRAEAAAAAATTTNSNEPINGLGRDGRLIGAGDGRAPGSDGHKASKQPRTVSAATTAGRFSPSQREQSEPRASKQPQPQPQPQRSQPERLVREGANSSDQLEFDLMGNRRQYESSEHWRYERETGAAAAAGGQPLRQLDEQGRRLERISQERMFSERVEVLRSSSISPPDEFADPKWGGGGGGGGGGRGRREQAAPAAPEATPSASAATRAPVWRRALSEERPARRTRLHRPALAGGSQPPDSRASDRRSPVADREPSAERSCLVKQQQQQQQELPKFERSADDEFRKRVDYLRKLARANLHQSGGRPESGSGGGGGRPAAQTKPMSTNWRRDAEPTPSASASASDLGQRQRPPPVSRHSVQQRTSASSLSPTRASLFDDRANWTLGRLSPANQAAEQQQPPLRRGSPTATATTNLDAIMADKETVARPRVTAGSSGGQPPPTTTFQWRRSNSSLASLGEQQQQRPKSPLSAPPPGAMSSSTSGERLLRTSQSNLSSLISSSSTSRQPEVMKLVVKERSAPRLNYAFVEQQQPQQQSQPQQPAPVAQSAPAKPQPRPQLRSQPTAAAQQQQARARTTTTPPLRVASPRSPEFGTAATSSNDDSAIASSVSSPSLSYLLPQAAAAAGAPEPARTQSQARPATSGIQNPQAAAAASFVPAPAPPPARHIPTLGGQSEPTPAAAAAAHGGSPLDSSRPQSILRRQHQVAASVGSSADTQFQPQLASQPGRRVSPAAAAHSNRNQQQRPHLEPEPEPQQNPEPAVSSYSSMFEHHQPLDQSTAGPTGGGGGGGTTRRVTFNDRTSIRSFESISSLASNSTAVPANEEAARRQLLGSPDSMGSGSTSRLSGESPDPAEPRPNRQQQQHQQGGGAAIYAIRGDPELDAAPAGQQQQQQQHQSSYQHQHHHHLYQASQAQQPAQRHFLAPASAGYGAQQQQPALQPLIGRPKLMLVQQQQQQQPYLRMTAPPSINMGLQQHPVKQQQQHQQRGPIQYIVRPTSRISTHISPVGRPFVAPIGAADDPEEPDYAMRLRQAASSRVFANYVQPAQPSQQQQQQQQQRRQPTMDELLSYQTEV